MKRKQAIIISLGVLAVVLVFSFLAYPRILEPVEESWPETDGTGAAQYGAFLSYKQALPQQSEEVSLAVVGDIMLSRVVADKITSKGEDYPWVGIADWLSGADIVFGNLETPFTPGRRILTGEMIFRADPELAAVLKRYNFSVLSLANNHTMNFGVTGLLDTLAALRAAGIEYVGAGKDSIEAGAPVYFEKGGLRFAFLAYNDNDVVPPGYEAGADKPGTAFMDIKAMERAVAGAKAEADFVIISMHSGVEYEGRHNRCQEDFARAAIEAGAELVIGHHPHVVQDVELYQGKYIFYSLGNIIFDQMWSQETRQALGAKIFFTRDGVSRIILYPFRIDDYAQPNPVGGGAAEDILSRLDQELETAPIFVWSPVEKIFKREEVATINGPDNPESRLTRRESADTDKNGQGEEYELNNGRLSIWENGKNIWSSPAEWWIDNFRLADPIGDGKVYLNLSVWKSGSFGASRPFWVDANDESVKNHYFVFQLVDGRMNPIWQSSNLEAPNCEFRLDDVDGDGRAELIVLEGDYFDWPSCRGRRIAVWEWNGWGFSNEWRSEAGEYHGLWLERIGGLFRIITR